jgi:hypothetical protein
MLHMYTWSRRIFRASLAIFIRESRSLKRQGSAHKLAEVRVAGFEKTKIN